MEKRKVEVIIELSGALTAESITTLDLSGALKVLAEEVGKLDKTASADSIRLELNLKHAETAVAAAPIRFGNVKSFVWSSRTL